MASYKMGVLALLLVAFAAATSAEITTYKAYLKGKNQVPTAVRSSAWGWAQMDLDDETETMTMYFGVTGIKDMFAAHVHNGTIGTNGPVVLPLYTAAAELPAGSSASTTVEGEFVTTYTAPLSAAPWFPDFLMSGNAYINVHTLAYPGGELRGQVNYVMPPATQTIADT